MKPSIPSLMALAALLLLAASPLASAKELEWNQEKVAALARDLDGPLQAFKADLQAHPAAPGKEAARAAVMDAVERLQSKARELAQRLASGAGRGDTVGLFHEVKALEVQAAKSTAAYPAPFDMHRHVAQIDDATNELGRYYGEYQAPGEWSKD